MDVKWQKNAHILIKSDSGYLNVDYRENIRRVSFFGHCWFIIKDWCSGGKESARLNKAIEKTLEAVRDELTSAQNELSLTLYDLPSSRDILNFQELDNYLGQNTKRTIAKVFAIVQKLILKGNGGFHLFGIPDYNYRTECLKDLPQAILLHSQANQQVKTHSVLHNIEEFFNLSFIQDEIKRELVQKEIQEKGPDWAGLTMPSLSYFD